jgi:hypothetical protein
MGLLRTIWKDLLWVSSRLTPAVKVASLVFLIALIVSAWHLGGWWNVPVVMKHESRPRWAVALVLFGIGFSVYLGWVIDRYRKRH